MADQAARQSAAVVRDEAQGITQPCGPTLVQATATAEPGCRCTDNAKSGATRTLSFFSKLRSTLAAGCPARYRRRDVVAATISRNFDCYACRPAGECCVAAGMGAAPAS